VITASTGRLSLGMTLVTCPCASAFTTAKQNAVALVAEASSLWCDVGYVPLPCLWPARETPAAAGFRPQRVAMAIAAARGRPKDRREAPAEAARSAA
jgi:hypothetical protein